MKVYIVIDDCIGIDDVRDKSFYLFRTRDDAVKKVVELFEKAIKNAFIPDGYEIDEQGYGQAKNEEGRLFYLSLDKDKGCAEVYDEHTFNEYIDMEEREI